jgi:hypothetical protein
LNSSDINIYRDPCYISRYPILLLYFNRNYHTGEVSDHIKYN